MSRSSTISIAFLLILPFYGCYNTREKGGSVDSGSGDDAAGEQSPFKGEQDANVAADTNREESPLTPRCAWGVDATLAEVGASAPDRINCGYEPTWLIENARSAMDCFTRALDSGASVEVTLNPCIDCSSPTTFVATAARERFAILMEEEREYGDDLREVEVKACDAFEATERGGSVLTVSCENERVLYACTEPLSIVR